jgi:formate C-acetyltransferase
MNTTTPLDEIRQLPISPRIELLKRQTLQEERFVSIEQARLITETYREYPNEPRNIQRARSLDKALTGISIRIDPDELVVGNRTSGIRAGVVFPEAGVEWIDHEIDGFPGREQDRFGVRAGDLREFREQILPFWRGKGLRDVVEQRLGPEIKAIEKVVKINQKDHAQGHICPHTEKWLRLGPSGLLGEARERAAKAGPEARVFYQGVVIALEAARRFMHRYAVLAARTADENHEQRDDLLKISGICAKLADGVPETFHEAVQSVWFLFVILHMESNASSFSPGRLDQILYPYLKRDLEGGRIDLASALEIIEALWLKFNQIVYLRNSASATYFAGFPIGFNVAVGGKGPDGNDATNELSYLFLRAQAHIGLPQPNFSARLHEGSPEDFVQECARVIGLGSGMPQVFNDESIVPALENQGVEHGDALNYAVVGCVELTTHGNMLGWSDAAMFNMVKALELALNGGRCLITGRQMGPDTGRLPGYAGWEELVQAYREQLDHFIERMMQAHTEVDRLHAELLPTPFLSAVIDDCMDKALDVTAGGARYNLSGIQAIQVANIADSLGALKKLVFDEQLIEPGELLEALEADFRGFEHIRQLLLNKAPKYGNDVAWVDEIGNKWVRYFAERVSRYTNARGGRCHTGLYTVSAHVPMGRNVGATPDGRRSGKPLADGGLSAVYGRDQNGPTALLKSVSRVDSLLGSNGTLLNMKFLPDFFRTGSNIKKFAGLLRTFVNLRIHHVQFNVVSPEILTAAQEKPQDYRSLTVRVAGYTAYFTELAADLQDEIIARTSYGSS